MFLGVRDAASDAALLERHGIAAVLTVGSAPEPSAADVLMKRVVKLGEVSKDPLLGHLPKAFAFINEGIAEGGVLVESADDDEAGAAAVVVGWLMAHGGGGGPLPWAEAPAAVSAARPSATLNANFEKQLKVWSTWKEFPGMPDWM